MLQAPQIVRFSKVSKAFASGFLFEDVTFTVHAGTITVLVGKNGAGKSTIARLMLGFEKPNRGEVSFAPGVTIGYLPQGLRRFENIPFDGAALLNVLAPGFNYELLLEFDEFLSILSLMKTPVADLSAGQLQKLMLVGTVLKGTNLLLLDEPIGFLDIESRRGFYKLLTYIKHKYQVAIFMISHDLFSVMNGSDQVICLNGHICCTGTPVDISRSLDLKNAMSEIGFYIHTHDHTHE